MSKTSNLFILGSVKFMEMMGGKKLGENMLPNEDQQEERYWE